MKCVAIGDMFLSEAAFQRELKDCGLFTSYQGFSWKHEENRKEARKIIRNIETKGAEAYVLPQDIQEAIIEADVVFVHLCPLGKEVLQRAKHLKYIMTARGGVENIAVEEAVEHKIRIVHCPMHNAFAVAEMTVGLMICETRNIARAHQALKQHEWRESYGNSGRIREIRSCTIGLIGFGAIGRLVAERLKAFGCRILIHDPFVKEDVIQALGYQSVDKSTLLRESDIVSLHGRIRPQDPPLIGKAELAMMKESAYLINTARAVLVDMDALAEALRGHHIMGAALDVFPVEPLAEDSPFLVLDNCTLTNHRGGDTLDSYERSPELLLAQLREVLETGSTNYII